MRGGLLLAAILLSAALAGCVGGIDDASESALDPSATGEEPRQAGTDYSRPAGEAPANVTTKLPGTEATPTEPGELPVDRGEYDFGYTVVKESDEGPAYTAKLNGSVLYPAEGEGPFPVVAFLHGQHGWCYYELGTSDELEHRASETCPEQTPFADAIPNFAGYDYIGQTLASSGFVVVNVNGNSVNEKNNRGTLFVAGERTGDLGTQSRAQLMLRTLDGFDEVNQGADPHPARENTELVDALETRLAMDEIGLVGHSRGGDGVTYAVEHNDERLLGEPHDIQAVFALAPTDFTDTRADDVAYAVLLPYCDGDVLNLWGAELYDRTRRTSSAPLYQYLVMGANHNFYNTVWTEHFDDAGGAEDDFCGATREEGGGRLSPAGQQAHGEALIAGFLRAQLGDAEEIEPWLQGRTLDPAGACPQAQAPCPSLIHASYHPAPDDRLVIESVADGEALDTNDLDGNVSIQGDLSADTCQPSECPSQPNRQLAPQLTLTWNGTGAYSLAIPDEHADLTSFEQLSLRAGVNHDAAENRDRARQDVSLRLVDEDGTSASVAAANYSQALFVPPGGDEDTYLAAEVTLNAISVPLAAFEGVDRTHVEEVAIVTDRTASGSIQVNDVMLQS